MQEQLGHYTVAIFTRNEAYHKFLAVFTAIGFSAYIALLFAHLG